MKKLSKEEMKKVVGGVMAPPDDGNKRYKCCPKGEPASPKCSTCITVPEGYHAVCNQGVVTPC